MKSHLSSLVLAILGGVLCLPAVIQSRPPTLDPTYGKEASAPSPATAESEKPAGPPAKWIWTANAANGQTVYARTTFSPERPPGSAALYVTADDSFEVFVNGEKVGATANPADPMAWVTVQRFSLKDRLKAGPNVIAVRAFNRDGPAGLLARLEVDGHVLLTTDEHWIVSDQDPQPADWNQSRFDASRWTKATAIAVYGQGPWGTALTGWPENQGVGYLAHLEVPPKSAQVVSGQVEAADTVATGSEGRMAVTPGGTKPVVVVDFGQELAGRLQVWGTDGVAVSVTTGESREECDHQEPKLNNNGPFDLKMAGAEPASTPYTAFRYAKLTFPAAVPAVVTRIVCDHKYYPVQYKGSFDCSDPLLTRIWYTGAYTAHLCMQEDIWDAPKRDRGLWIGDLQATGQTINDVFADRFLMEQSIARVRLEAQHGRPITALPAADVNNIPGYSAAWFCTLADFYRHLGDRVFLESQHAAILSLLEYQQTEFDAKNVYVNGKKWDFCDWAAGFVLDGPRARATTHLYIVYGLHEAVFLLRELGDTANADRYAAWAEQLTAAARAQFTDPANIAFSNRLQENVMAILSDTAKPVEDGGLYDRFVGPGSPNWKVRQTGDIDESEAIAPYYGYFVLQTMEKLGRKQDGVGLLRRYWGDMLRRGATSWWEKFDPAWPENLRESLDKMPYLSLSHGWSTGPTSFLTEAILGVRPTGAGYRTAEISPHLGDLQWAEGDVPTPEGVIHVRVERQNGGTTATVKLPAKVSATLRLGGKVQRADQAGTYQISDR